MKIKIALFILFFLLVLILNGGKKLKDPDKSPILNKDNTVTFYYKDKLAKKVFVSGFFNDWKPQALKQDNNGIWSYTTSVLKEGTYAYLFQVDGKWIPDPLNKSKSGKKKIESVFDVGKGDYLEPIKECKADPIKEDNKLVIVTLNTHSFQEKTNRFKKLYWIANALKDLNADIVGLNEIIYGNIYSRGYKGKYYDTSEIIKNHLECLTKRKYFIYRVGFAKWDEGEVLANVILSRYPLYNSNYKELTTKDFWPAPESKRNCIFSKAYIHDRGYINVFVTHPMGYDYNDTAIQINEIKDFVKSKISDDILGTIVMGDFNIPQNHKYYSNLIKQSPEFIDTFAKANPSRFSAPSTMDKKHRIDYIFWVDNNGFLKNKKIESEIIFKNNNYKNIFFPLVSDHFGVVTTIFLDK